MKPSNTDQITGQLTPDPFMPKQKATKPTPAPVQAPALKPLDLARDYLPALSLDDIDFDDANARDDAEDKFDDQDEDTKAFIESIKAKGVQQPVWVRRAPAGSKKKYVLIAGERRVRGSLAAGKLTIPAFDYGKLHDDVAAELADLENCQRENLTTGQRIRAYAAMVRNHGWQYWDEKNPAKSLGHRLNLGGKSASYQWSRLASLPLLALQAIDSGDISASVAAKIAGIFDNNTRKEATECAIQDKWTDADAEEYIGMHYTAQLKGVSFDTDDATLFPNAGSCKECPFRSGNQADFIGGRGDICGKPACLRDKEAAQFARDATTHKGTVWTAAQARKAGLNDNYCDLHREWVSLARTGQLYQVPFDAGKKTLKEHLGKEVRPEEIILALSNDGRNRRFEILPLSRVQAILLKLKLLKPSKVSAPTSGVDVEKARRESVANARRIVDAVVAKCVDAAVNSTAQAESPLLKILVHHIATELYDDTARAIAKRRNLEPAALALKNKNASHREMVPAYAATCSPAERMGLLVEMLCYAGVGYNGEVEPTNWDDTAHDIAKWLDIDIAAELETAKKTHK